MKIRSRAEAGIDKILARQRIIGGAVRLFPVVLEIWTLVPCKAEHLEIVLDSIDELGLRALPIKVLDAQDDATIL